MCLTVRRRRVRQEACPVTAAISRGRDVRWPGMSRALRCAHPVGIVRVLPPHTLRRGAGAHGRRMRRNAVSHFAGIEKPQRSWHRETRAICACRALVNPTCTQGRWSTLSPCCIHAERGGGRRRLREPVRPHPALVPTPSHPGLIGASRRVRPLGAPGAPPSAIDLSACSP